MSVRRKFAPFSSKRRYHLEWVQRRFTYGARHIEYCVSKAMRGQWILHRDKDGKTKKVYHVDKEWGLDRGYCLDRFVRGHDN